MSALPEYAVRNRALWTRHNADRRARADWAGEEITRGMCNAREEDVRMLPDLRRKDVVELGCGTGYFGARLKRAGARRVVGVDVTPAQLETARRMRTGGEIVFLRDSTLRALCTTDDESTSEILQRPQRGLHRLDWPDGESTELHLGHGDWIRLLSVNDFELVRLVELYADERTPEHTMYAFSRSWAEQWPWEEIWRARKRA